MREVKRTIPMYSFYDRTGIQNYLEAQAAGGWMLEKAGTVCWKFRRMEPKKLKFSVVYFPAADLYDPAPGEGEQTFREFCEHSGWKFAGSQAQMQIFYNESANPVPIDTDPVIEVENIHKSMKKSVLSGYWLLMVSAMLQLISQGISFFDRPVSYLSYDMNLYFLFFWPSMLLMCLIRIICYHRWHRRAEKAAQEGIFLESAGSQRLEACWAILALGGLALLLVFGRSPLMVCTVILGVAVALGLIGTEVFTREALKRKGYDAKANKIGTIAVAVVVMILIVAVVTPVVVTVLDNATEWRKDELPLKLSDLMDTEHGTLVMENTESALLGYVRTVQYTDQLGGGPELQYKLIHVKAKFLYDLCLNNLEMGNAWELVPTGGAPWGAKRAWICMDGEEAGGYILCYDDYILDIWTGWDMTAEQMAIVGNIFG